MAVLNMPRIFDGGFTHGEMHFYTNVLDGVGSSTTLHAHEFPHVSIFYPGDAGDCRYRVTAIMADKTEKEITLDAWHFVYLGAGIAHRIELVSGDVGKFVCMFATHGPDGSARIEPKIPFVDKRV